MPSTPAACRLMPLHRRLWTLCSAKEAARCAARTCADEDVAAQDLRPRPRPQDRQPPPLYSLRRLHRDLVLRQVDKARLSELELMNACQTAVLNTLVEGAELKGQSLKDGDQTIGESRPHVQQDAHDMLVDLGQRPRGAGLLVRVRPHCAQLRRRVAPATTWKAS